MFGSWFGVYVERDAAEWFVKLAAASKAVAVVGPRQAGKTTFLEERVKGLNASFVSFNDPDARGLFEDDVKKFEKQFLEGKDVSVLDEVHYCKDAGLNLKYLVDAGRRLWITSSTEMLLSKRVLSHLVGRVSVLKLYPFSLPEFLRAKGLKEFTAGVLERSVWEHAVYGGYPKIVLSSDVEVKKSLLQDLYSTLLLKDVANTFSIDDLRSLEQLAKWLAVNAGGVLSYDSAARGVGISFQTLKKYLDAMEKSYLVARVPPFYSNKLKEVSKQPKVFFFDCGLRNAIAKTFPNELDGASFENYVFTELVKASFEPKYWRTKTGLEVDFVVEKNGAVIPIEVKLAADENRVERSLRSFIEAHEPSKAFVVSLKETRKRKKNEGKKGAVKSGAVKVGGCRVVFTNVFELLSELKNA